MKIVGNRKANSLPVAAASPQQIWDALNWSATCNELSPPVYRRKGVMRFKTHEEKNRFEDEELARSMALNAQRNGTHR